MDGYLAILQGRCRRSFGSLQIPYILRHFYRVWGCRARAGSHSFHLVAEEIKHQCLVRWSNNLKLHHRRTQTQNFEFPHDFILLGSTFFKSDVNPSLNPSSLSISMWLQPNRKGLSVSCYCATTDRKQEVGTRIGAGTSSRFILAIVACYFKTHTQSVTPARQTGRSFRTKTGIPVSGHGLMFCKTTQEGTR